MMVMKFSLTFKVIRVLTDRRPVRPAADDDFEIHTLLLLVFKIVESVQCIFKFINGELYVYNPTTL